MTRRREIVQLVSQGYPYWYAYALSHGMNVSFGPYTNIKYENLSIYAKRNVDIIENYIQLQVHKDELEKISDEIDTKKKDLGKNINELIDNPVKKNFVGFQTNNAIRQSIQESIDRIQEALNGLHTKYETKNNEVQKLNKILTNFTKKFLELERKNIKFLKAMTKSNTLDFYQNDEDIETFMKNHQHILEKKEKLDKIKEENYELFNIAINSTSNKDYIQVCNLRNFKPNVQTVLDNFKNHAEKHKKDLKLWNYLENNDFNVPEWFTEYDKHLSKLIKLCNFQSIPQNLKKTS